MPSEANVNLCFQRHGELSTWTSLSAENNLKCWIKCISAQAQKQRLFKPNINWKPSEVSWVPKLAPALKVFTKSSELLFSWPCWGSGIMNQNPEPAKVKTFRSSPIIVLYHRCKSDLEILPQQSYLSRILLWTGKINLYWKLLP